MRERYEELVACGCQVIVIIPSGRSLLEKFVQAFGPFPFPIYGDPARDLYNGMGHKTMKKWKLLYLAGKAFLKGGTRAFFPDGVMQKRVVREAMKTQDVYIQGGSWIFNDKGSVIWSHIDTSPEDHASIDRIIIELKK